MVESRAVASELCFEFSDQATSHEGQNKSQTTENKIGGHHDLNWTKRSGMFRYADRTDYILMFFGTFGAAGNGILITLFSLFFGDLVCEKVFVYLSCKCD
jgi:hypothetical protein